MRGNAPQADYVNHLDDREARWFAVYTRYKREKLVHQRLREQGIDTYLPLRQFTRRYTRKVRTVDLPLINCYIFTKITKPEYVRVLETPDVVHFVRFANHLISIPEKEINILRRVVGEGIDIDVEPTGFREGDLVEIIGGNLTGIQGRLIDTGEKNFLIELTQVGYSLRMRVEGKWLRKV